MKLLQVKEQCMIRRRNLKTGHLAKHIAVIEGHEDSTHFIQAYTDGSKNEEGVG